jgi:glycolate oxidase iron-sulfur subunit
MRTHFRAEQLSNPALAEAEKNLRACVHCGMCTATCPTYVLLGDERDSPRGRIVMMQKMLEHGGAPSDETVVHLDRCLSCLGCKTACPSGVDYARLIDQSRVHIQQHYRRPATDRLLRWTIANVLTRPRWSRAALPLAKAAAPLRRLLPKRFRAMAEMARRIDASGYAPEWPAATEDRRIALLPGCVQQVIAPEIDTAAARLLARRGYALIPLQDAGCCGALAHHLGREADAKAWAKRSIAAFERANTNSNFDGVLITATGCAAHIADYPHLFREDPQWQNRAKAFAARLVQLSALLSSPVYGGGAERSEAEGGSPISPYRLGAEAPSHLPRRRGRIRVALQVPCSQQHGLRVPDDTKLLENAGYEVVSIPEGHLCCGSAGSYSILHPEIAAALRNRKLENIRAVHPDVIATSNIGCLQHLSGSDAPPVVHVAELLDWAEGGPVPRALQSHPELMAHPAETT